MSGILNKDPVKLIAGDDILTKAVADFQNLHKISDEIIKNKKKEKLGKKRAAKEATKQKCLNMWAISQAYVHVTSQLTEPFRPRPCDQIIILRPNLFLHHERANRRVLPCNDLKNFVFFLFSRLFTWNFFKNILDKHHTYMSGRGVHKDNVSHMPHEVPWLPQRISDQLH